jgi:hypothetical protein
MSNENILLWDACSIQEQELFFGVRPTYGQLGNIESSLLLILFMFSDIMYFVSII